MSTVQALCPVTDPGPSAFHFALHDHPQTNTYICALWIFPVTVPGSCCLPLTHTRSHKPADGSRVGHWPHSLSSGWFGPLGPSRSQLSDHSGLPGIQPRSMASPFYGFQASFSPTNPAWYLQMCTHWYTSLHSTQSSPKKAASSLIKNLFHLQLLKSHLSGALLQRSLEQELPCAYSI